MGLVEVNPQGGYSLIEAAVQDVDEKLRQQEDVVGVLRVEAEVEAEVTLAKDRQQPKYL